MSLLPCFVSSDKKTWLLTASDWNNKKIKGKSEAQTKHLY
jgi:hypothetical protein